MKTLVFFLYEFIINFIIINLAVFIAVYLVPSKKTPLGKYKDTLKITVSGSVFIALFKLLRL